MSEEEGPNNEHEVEGVQGRWRREHYKGWKWGGGCYGGGVHNMIDNNYFFKHYQSKNALTYGFFDD
jgi:hypothetical protein